MKPIRFVLAGLVILMPLLCGCGAGAGGVAAVLSEPASGGGIGGTGLTTSGSINGFGSIFVNGVEYETDNAEILINGEPVSEEQLRLGMVVQITATAIEDGVSATATRVIYNSAVQGPVERITPRDGGDTVVLAILGQDVVVERSSTVFENVSFHDIALNSVLQVSGFNANGRGLLATRVERVSDFVPGVSEIELVGEVTNLDGAVFSLGELSVDFSTADLSALPGGELSPGLVVQVLGTLEGDRISAQQITPARDIRQQLTDNQELSIEGALSGFEDPSRFLVDGVPVNAENAVLEPMELNLGNGLIVQVDGSWNGTALLATSVRARRGRVAIEAVLSAIETAGNTIDLRIRNETIRIQTDAQTLVEDSTRRVDRVSLDNFSSGDFVAAEAISDGSSLLATRIIRQEPGADLVQASVESFNPGLDVTLLGVVYDTQDTLILGGRDRAVSSNTFYDQLQVGDLVRITDDAPADGIADKLVFNLIDAR